MDRSLAAALEAGEADPTFKTIQFTTVEEVFREINCAAGDVLVVKCVSPRVFKALEQEREVQMRKFRYNLYGEDSQCLVITIRKGLHERLHSWLYLDGVYGCLHDMGVARSWDTLGSTTFYTEALHPGSGEGDSSGGPHPERSYPEAYPTLIIEAGFSSPLEYLQFKAKWWFSISKHEIKIVVLAKFYHDKRTIVLQRWEERQQGLRAGAATTRWGSKWVASCHQEITITITESSENPPVYQVAGGDLVLSFQQLFLRNPQAGEGDVVTPVIELQWYAARVWSQVV